MDPPAVATLQGMARQRATLQATERMRTLKWALASVDDSIAFAVPENQELLEAFNQAEAGVHKMGKRQREESDAARKRTVTMSPATEQTLGTPMDTTATMQNHHNSPPMQASSSAAESDAATEHIAAGAETTMSLDAIVTELNTLSTDAARGVVTAAQVILKAKEVMFAICVIHGECSSKPRSVIAPWKLSSRSLRWR